MENRPLKERMMEYEGVTKYQFPSDSVIVARIDGRGFSKLTKSMAKPFDNSFTAAMVEVTRVLVEETNATIGYTQSDEISLVWHTDNPNGQVFFNGKLQKLCSVCASIATHAFGNCFCPGELMGPAYFDCRVFTVPSKEEAVNYLVYRMQDATRNSVSMAAHTHFGHKKLMNKNVKEQLEMLISDSINWDNFAPANKIGTWVQRQTFETTMLDRATSTDVPCRRNRVANLKIPSAPNFAELFKIVFGE